MFLNYLVISMCAWHFYSFYSVAALSVSLLFANLYLLPYYHVNLVCLRVSSLNGWYLIKLIRGKIRSFVEFSIWHSCKKIELLDIGDIDTGK